jgi:radical SAM superfamily enzyme YgiQ (UPF0313 family)
MKKLLLVNPVGQTSGYLLSKFSTIPPMSLAYVAAVTPSDWEIKIADENFGRLEVEDTDLVGISAFTSNINRAYEIARTYRNRGIKVVLGGIHASMLPDEALQYADAVVIGEAEQIWGKVVEDFENNRLSGKYLGPRVDLTNNAVRPRRDLIDPRYLFQSIQTSRGCPFDCNFCTVSKYLGKEYRQRRAQDVLDELQEIEGEYLFFLDDNLIGHSRESIKRAKDIFAGMIKLGLNKKWWMQTSIDSTKDEEVLKLAADAGCMFAFIGFETISEMTLQGMQKGINLKIGVENYKKVVKALHYHGIGVVGAFIIGNDHESPLYYRQLAKFLVRSGIDVVQMAILTPLPGTVFMGQMEKYDRLLYKNFPEDWDKYRLSYVVRQPEGVEPETIYIGDNYVKHHIYSFPWNQYRILKSFLSMRNPKNSYAVYRFNKALKKSWQGSHYFRKYPAKFPLDT